eukprot:9311869-Pyramimonas_sp.AAC.1
MPFARLRGHAVHLWRGGVFFLLRCRRPRGAEGPWRYCRLCAAASRLGICSRRALCWRSCQRGRHG